MIEKYEAYLIVMICLGLAVAAGGGYFHHQGYLAGKKEVQTEFDTFKNEVKAAALKAEQDKINKEKEDADKIAAANAARDDALARLRVQAARPRVSLLPGVPPGSNGSGQICFDRPALDSALRRLDQGVSGLVGEGDKAMIDALTLLKAWPAQSSPASGKP